MGKMNILAFGGCTLNAPIDHAIDVGTRVAAPPSPWIPDIYTIKEVVQMLDVWAGRIALPTDLRPFITPWPDRLVARPGALDSIDVVLLETSSEVELLIDGFTANRAAISVNVLRPVKEISKDAHRQLSNWYTKGITKFDETMRSEGAKGLIPLIPDDFPNAPMLKRIVADLRSEPADVRTGFSEVRKRLRVPIGIVPFVFQYFADGRHLYWPAGFHQSIVAAAAEQGFPMFATEQLVLSNGVETAMRPDMRHYRDDFIDTVATALVDFADHVRRCSETDPATAVG